jgi:hypothetical protein
MDEITEIVQEIERLRSKLVVFTVQAGDFMHEGVLNLSHRLDELINIYYRLISNNESSDFNRRVSILSHRIASSCHVTLGPS